MVKKSAAPSGFTLIEMLIVLAIIGLLITIAVVALNTTQKRTRDMKRISDMTNLQTALELYYDSNATFPALTTASTWSDVQVALKAHTDKLPLPPSPTDEVYVYMVDGANNNQRYVIGATLEDEAHKVFAEDVDDLFGSSTSQAGAGVYQTPGWDLVTSQSDVAALDGTGVVNCGDPVYCRFREAQ